MTGHRLSEFPLLLKVAVAVTFFNTWILFEETIIDRHGLWEYLPYYRVARLCAWDIGAAVLIVSTVWWAFRRLRRRVDD
jgi:hypothetical protein